MHVKFQSFFCCSLGESWRTYPIILIAFSYYITYLLYILYVYTHLNIKIKEMFLFVNEFCQMYAVLKHIIYNNTYSLKSREIVLRRICNKLFSPVSIKPSRKFCCLSISVDRSFQSKHQWKCVAFRCVYADICYLWPFLMLQSDFFVT